MYTQFFQLKQSPFSIAPDPRYLFMSERHREALAHLLYGIGSGGGFVLLTGEIGAGKTTVCRCFMEQIPDNCKLAYIFNPKLSVEELLLSICDEFGIALAPAGAGAVSVKAYVDAINGYLLASHARGVNNVLIIDEAQNLSADVLEQLRLLTNLETSERKLLQIILIGQPELRAMLARPELEQLAQRVIARYHLGSLSAEETGSYIEHRLAVAGATAVAPFPRRLMGQVHKLAKGVPRRINLLCDRALLGAYVENQPQVTRTILRRAAAEVFAGQETLGGDAGVLRGWGMGAGGKGWPKMAAGVVVGVAAGAVLSAAVAWRWMPAAPTNVAGVKPAAQLAAKAPAKAGTPAVTALPAGAVAAGPAPALAATLPVPVPASAIASGGAEAAPDAAAAPTPASPAERGAPVLRQLAALWGLALPDGDVCQNAARANLRCLQGKGGIEDLRLLDRPAMLVLRGEVAGTATGPTAPVYALLTALDGGNAVMVIDGKRQSMGLDVLAARFDGEFTTFWRTPRGWRDEVSGGDHGPDVDGLAKRLAQIYGLKKPQENQPLDGALQKRLKDFQAAQHLKADGVAGPKTFIRLNQLAGVQEPRLLARTAGAADAAGVAGASAGAGK